MSVRSTIIALCAATVTGGAFAFGIDVRQAAKPTCASTFVPLNSLMFRMRQPDGIERLFVRNWDDPNRLHGTAYPWKAAIRPERRMVNVFTDPSFRGERTEFCFVDGTLRFLSVGKKDYEFSPDDFPANTNDVRSLWPAETLTAREKVKNDMWRGGRRLRFLSNNPNRSALLFVQLGLLALTLAFFGRTKIWRLHGVLLTLIFVSLLVQTASRGGFASFGVGAAVLLFIRARRGVSRRTLCWIVGLTLVFVLVPFALKVGARQGGDSLSTRSRLVIWSEVPRLLRAAPWGWGLWKSGSAYNAWFEKPGNLHMIGDLFNDHFSRLTEGGLVWGSAYVFGWCLFFLFGGRLARRGGSPVPLAQAAAYFVASSFNPMNYWLPSFAVPVAAAGLFFVGPGGLFRRNNRRADTRLVGCAFVATLGIVLAVTGCALCSSEQDVPLRVGWLGRRVIVGEGEPKVWLVDDGYVLSGDYYGFPGKEIRAHYRKRGNVEPLGIVSDLSDLPVEIDRLIVTGRCCERYVREMKPRARHVLLLTPPFGSDKIPKELVQLADLHVLTGEHVARLTGDDKLKSPRVHVYPGAEAYVPGWLDVVLRKR